MSANTQPSSRHTDCEESKALTVREWFLTWYRCFYTLRTFSKVARSLAVIQLVAAFLRGVWLPFVLIVQFVKSWMCAFRYVFSGAQPSAGGAKEGAAAHPLPPPSLEALLTKGSVASFCIDLSRRASMDSLFMRLLARQSEREDGQEHEVFYAVDGGTAGMASSLTSSQTTALIRSVSCVVAAELFAAGAHFGELERPDTDVMSHTVALMLPNSVHYPSIWMGVSYASAILSLLDVGATSKRINPKSSPLETSNEPATRTASRGHSCSSALLNTYIANNSMFGRSIASSGARMLVVDAAYVWLLFAEASQADDAPQADASHRRNDSRSLHKPSHPVVSLPAGIKKVLLWHSEPVVVLGGSKATLRAELPCNITIEQLQAIAEYNDAICTSPRRKHELYADEAEELSALWLSNMALYSMYPWACVNAASTVLAAAPEGKSSESQSRARSQSPPAKSSAALSPSQNVVKSPPLASSFSKPPPMPPIGGSGSSQGSHRSDNGSNSTPTTSSNAKRNSGTTPVTSPGGKRTLSSACISKRITRRLPYLFVELVLDHLGMVLDGERCCATVRQFVGSNRATTAVGIRWRSMWNLYRAIRGSFRSVDPVLKIYTSGTTGLPKAAKFTHLRFHLGILLSKNVDIMGRTRRLFRPTQDAPVKEGSGQKRGESFEEATSVLTIYNTLPMYHSAGGMFCMAHLITCLQVQQARPCLEDGTVPSARMVIRKKFSASNYASELQTHRVHIVQYIGEILRYAVAAAEKEQSSSAEVHHTNASAWKVPVAIGNGLRRDVWMGVLKLLPIASLVEFYASTEGNVGAMNSYDEPFAVGHMPVFPWPFQSVSPLYWGFFPMKLVQYDPETGCPRRFSDGLCRTAPLGGEGELLGKVPQGGIDPIGLRRFDGYHDASETKKKLVTDVLRRGDLFFRSGDLLRVDRRGFLTFIDRVGDTFRWKGENVSTMEVANAMNLVADPPSEASCGVAVHDAVVYGVPISGREGKAGMAKFTLSFTPPVGSKGSKKSRQGNTAALDTAAEVAFLRERLFPMLSSKSAVSSLPMYATPVFLRVAGTPSIDGNMEDGSTAQGTDEMTSTFKHRPAALASEGFMSSVPNSYAVAVNAAQHGGPPTTGGSDVPSSTSDSSRYYVLVSRKVMHALGYTSTTAPWGYVPLNDALLEHHLGPLFQHAGW